MDSLSGSKISFMDINEERLDSIYKLAVRYAKEVGINFKF